MDPDTATLIVEALGAGALAASKDTAGRIVTDAYDELKELLRQALSRRPRGGAAVDEREALESRQHGSGDRQLVEELQALDVDPEALVAAAKRLKAAVGDGADRTTYNTQVTNSQGVIVGSNNKAEMTFNSLPAPLPDGPSV